MSHIPPGFASIGGELAIAGRPASAWVAEAGDTPLFVYDAGRIAARIAELRAALPPGVALHYAMKANPMPDLLRWIAPRVDGIDVASAGELAAALAAGADPAHISFAGPGKRDRELAAAIDAGITLNVESEGEFERTLIQSAGRPFRVAVRVNPPFDLKGSGMRMGGGAKPFGVDAERVPALLARIGETQARFEGFHVFAGSQNLSADAIVEAQRATVALVAELAAHAPGPVRHVNLGGGFGLPYFPGDAPLDLAAVGAGLAETLANRPTVLETTQFALELGRFLVGEAGVYLTRVVDKKTSLHETFVVVDGGLHHQLAASGNFGTVIRRNYPLANASRFGDSAVMKVNVVGCLCTPLDRLGDRVELPETGVGDLIAVFMAGAYGRTASPAAFLGHPAPLEVFAGAD